MSFTATTQKSVFAGFAGPARPRTPLREAIDAAHRQPEPVCVPSLIEAATMAPATAVVIRDLTLKTVSALRAKTKRSGVEGLMREYALSSQEGIALMCLAEALLRTPDSATRDALIADKIAPGDWQSHLGQGRSLFVNAATWGLALTGKLVTPVDDTGLENALTRLVARSGEPVIRAGVNMAMKMMGEQFVSGETIREALRNGRKAEARGFAYSYDMLGEAATTAADAARYFEEYRTAIEAIGRAAKGRGVYAGPGISIKLSALHPRYARSQYDRVMTELLPRVVELATLAAKFDIGLNIDAEEADRLDISLDILEALCFEPELRDWQGIGFVVQAYSKRCPAVVDFLIDLARRSGHRIMVRLVKGAYWDSEIKRAQVDGLEGFPVYTRKVHTDVAYIACAKKLLAARRVVFPQFATHNAQTMATIFALAGPEFALGDYEFQCLHGMGEPLYDEVVGTEELDRPCRIYAPVGSHETLLAYLVRRLLENGANSSFVNRIADPAVSLQALAADPALEAAGIVPIGAPHEAIALPRDILGTGRVNSRGLDLSSEVVLQTLAAGALNQTPHPILPAERRQNPPLPQGARGSGHDALPVSDHGTADKVIRNPADHLDIVGSVVVPDADQMERALISAKDAAPGWAATPPSVRADMLERAADLMEAEMPRLMAQAMREAGKTAANGVAEVREAVDFLRYYAGEARGLEAAYTPLGPVVCISPWNFPLAIFSGQVAAALAAGNTVLAKPAEETPLIAIEAVELFHRAGIPAAVLQVLAGDGETGAALVGDARVHGVMFTGSTEVAKLIQRQLAERTLPDGRPVPLIAETGGQNAMIVDSSALAEQVVVDVLASAFDSAGQRCSALRLLCLREECADRILEMLKGAMAELRVGNPGVLATDVGPVISEEARGKIAVYVDRMRAKGHAVTALPLPDMANSGTFVAPTIIELGSIGELGAEIFGPVLHVVRFARDGLGATIDAINGLGYGLTFGLHTRIDTTIATVTGRIEAGNLYVNRNQIGAVVGVQPFGGHGLSGTGPKAGGPLYLRRLVRRSGEAIGLVDRDLAGPVGERNRYLTKPRGTVLVVPRTEAGLRRQMEAVVATGNRAVIEGSDWAGMIAKLPAEMAGRITQGWAEPGTIDAVLLEGDASDTIAMAKRLAEWPGPIVLLQSSASGDYDRDLLVKEVSISINTAAAGGNASLMALV